MTTSLPAILVPTLEERLAISAYHSAVSQHVLSLLQTHNAGLTSSEEMGRKSTIKGSKGKGDLLDPSMKVEVLVDGEIKPDLLDERNIGKMEGSSPDETGSTSRNIALSEATQQSATIITPPPATPSPANGPSSRGRSKSVRRQGTGGIERSQSYEMKRNLKFAKHRKELERKVNTWWEGVLEVSPEGSSLSDFPSESEIIDTKPSPSITVQLSPFIAFDTAYNGIGTGRHYTPNINFSSSCARGGLAFNLHGADSHIHSEIAHDQDRQSPSGLIFSENASKAILKSRPNQNDQNSSERSDGGIREDWLLNVLGESKQWDVPYRHQHQREQSKAKSKSRSPGGNRFSVMGEMPTPKPVAAGTSLWG
ncbi:hypothetical protein I302_107067 [Kwoniella bestiolae CBS 10118]|uniref:Uncharacterized protein n=1 Tax=Kwoniella bestiolae CBS 10118 TaxID=1296100 RepID=A0A1B9FZM1_9TREE|nr:hypothetical protein I302_05668 [Kwoniella bestiolae CBS 10118]OCF24209.1 hypothetical protein I302_05668 [Kwoniella bestiolae CBS 10118]